MWITKLSKKNKIILFLDQILKTDTLFEIGNGREYVMLIKIDQPNRPYRVIKLFLTWKEIATIKSQLFQDEFFK